MDMNIIKAIAQQLNITTAQIETVLKMLEEGDTVPFIARYRKEATGALDEEQILTIEKNYKYELNLSERKESVLNLIETQGKLTEELRKQIEACTKLSQVEDLYKPYKQKKKTRAAIAIKNGLQPLADLLLSLPISIWKRKHRNISTTKSRLQRMPSREPRISSPSMFRTTPNCAGNSRN